MVEVTRKALQCDFPDCLEESEVDRISVTIRQRKLEVDLCEQHQETVTVSELGRYAHRKPRTRGVVAVDPVDIPKRSRRGRT